MILIFFKIFKFSFFKLESYFSPGVEYEEIEKISLVEWFAFSVQEAVVKKSGVSNRSAGAFGTAC